MKPVMKKKRRKEIIVLVCICLLLCFCAKNRYFNRKKPCDCPNVKENPRNNRRSELINPEKNYVASTFSLQS
jgi:hypothetical protein